MPKEKSPSVGSYLLDSLHNYGVENIFGIPGDYILQFDKLIEEHPHIKFIGATRENPAGYMADAYARLKGLGVVCITYGVGINIANALSQAYTESSPIVVISGTAGTEEFAKGHKLHHYLNKKSIFHQMDTTQLEIFSHFTVDQAVLTSPLEAKSQIDRVLWSCIKHKKPVYIEIPRNIALQPLPIVFKDEASLEAYHHPTHPVIPKSTPACRAAAEEPLLDKIQSILDKCSNPIIWAGHEILRYNLSKFVLQFAEKYQIPIVSTLLGKTVVNENHPLFLGVYLGEMSVPHVKAAIERSDCIFQLGALLSDVDTGIFTAKQDYKHKINCNADEISIDSENFYGIDFSDFIKALAEKTFKTHINSSSSKPEQPSITFTPKSNTPLTSARLFACISSYLTEENIVTVDFGDSLFGSSDFMLNTNSFICSSYFASLGFGIPAAIAAQLAEPKRRTIGIVGDGAFQMTATELSTAAKYKLDPILIILNNHGYGTERPLLEGSYNDIHNWNYSLLPKCLNGGKGIKVNTETAFDEAFKESLNQRGEFYLIEVELDKTDFSPSLKRFLSFAEK